MPTNRSYSETQWKKPQISSTLANMTDDDDELQPLHPPLRFNVIQPNLYRGSYPRPRNLDFLLGLGLKTILSITPSPLGTNAAEDQWLLDFAAANNIQLIHVKSGDSSAKSKKKRGVPIAYEVVRTACEYMIDAEKAPLYVHCVNGSHVTCLVVACLRKLSFWSTAAISDEFLRYGDMELADRQFVEGFRAEISVPPKPVSWVWKGLSRQGIVRNHPTLKISEKPEEASVSNQETAKNTTSVDVSSNSNNSGGHNTSASLPRSATN